MATQTHNPRSRTSAGLAGRLESVIAYMDLSRPLPRTGDFYALLAEVFFAIELPKSGPARYLAKRTVKTWVHSMASYAIDLEDMLRTDAMTLHQQHPEIFPPLGYIGDMVVPDAVFFRLEKLAGSMTVAPQHRVLWKRIIRLKR